MFSRRSGDSNTASERSDSPSLASARPAADSDADRALDALAGVIRAIGRHAIDHPDSSAVEVGTLAEAWALHLLILRPRPNDASNAAPKRRDFAGALEFASSVRKTEHASVTRALADLRQTVWMFVQSLNRALSDDETTDVEVTSTLDNLRRVAESGSTEELRRAAVSTASTVSNVVRARRDRQRHRNLEIGARIAALGAQLEEARRERDTDALTGLYNRGAFDQFIGHVVDLRSLRHDSTCLLLLDVDHFKAINDRYGHPVGDEVLRALGACLTRTILRRQDFIARYGGEEFVVVLPETELHDALRLAERIRGCVSKLRFASAEALHVSVSIGVATLHDRDDVSTLVARADEALYHAKESGRDRVVSLD